MADHRSMAYAAAASEDQERILRYEAELNDLQKKLDDRKEMDRLRAELADTKAELGQVSDQVLKDLLKMDGLRDQLAKVKGQLDQARELARTKVHEAHADRCELTAVKKALATSESNLESTRNELAATTAKRDVLTQKLVELAAVTSQSEARNKDLEDQCMRYLAENDSLKNILQMRGLEDVRITATIGRPPTSPQAPKARAERADSLFDSAGASPGHSKHILDEDENDILGLNDTPKLVATVKGQPSSSNNIVQDQEHNARAAKGRKSSTETCTGAAKAFKNIAITNKEGGSSAFIRDTRNCHRITDRNGDEMLIPMPESVVADGKVLRLEQGPNDHLDQGDWNRLSGISTWAEDLTEEEKGDYWESFAAANPRYGPAYWQFLYEKIVSPELLRRKAASAATDNVEQPSTVADGNLDQSTSAEPRTESESEAKAPSLEEATKTSRKPRAKKPKKARNRGGLRFYDTTWDRALEATSQKSAAFADAEANDSLFPIESLDQSIPGNGQGATGTPLIDTNTPFWHSTTPQAGTSRASQSKHHPYLLLDKYMFETGVRPQDDRELARRTVRITGVPKSTLLNEVISAIRVPGATILSASYLETSKMRCTPPDKYNTVVLKFSTGESARNYALIDGSDFWSSEDNKFVRSQTTLEPTFTPPMSAATIFDIATHGASRVIGLSFENDGEPGFAYEMMQLATSTMASDSSEGLKGEIPLVQRIVEPMTGDTFITLAFEFASLQESKRVWNLFKNNDSRHPLILPRKVRYTCCYLPDPIGEELSPEETVEIEEKTNILYNLVKNRKKSGKMAMKISLVDGTTIVEAYKDFAADTNENVDDETSTPGMTPAKAAAILAHANKMGLK